MPKALFVIPIAAADARAWVTGEVGDFHLLFRAPLLPEAVFVGELPDLLSWRPMMRLCAHWRLKGATCMVGCTSNQVIVDHLTPYGWQPHFQETETRRRYILPHWGFCAWLDSTKPRRPAAPGPTLRYPILPPLGIPAA